MITDDGFPEGFLAGLPDFRDSHVIQSNSEQLRFQKTIAALP